MSDRRSLPCAALVVALAWLAVAPAAALLASAAVAAPQPSAEAGSPQALMEDVSRRMFAALDSNRAAIRKDAQQVYPLVDQILLPHFDTEYAAQLVLAQHWRSATPEQRKRFIDALYHLLLRTYSDALADFTADRLMFMPFRGDPAANQATVHTKVTRASGVIVPVDYRLHRTADGWKAFDVVIEGISYVRNYKTDLGAEVDKRGLDAVIARLEHETPVLGTPAAAPTGAGSHRGPR